MKSATKTLNVLSEQSLTSINSAVTITITIDDEKEAIKKQMQANVRNHRYPFEDLSDEQRETLNNTHSTPRDFLAPCRPQRPRVSCLKKFQVLYRTVLIRSVVALLRLAAST